MTPAFLHRSGLFCACALAIAAAFPAWAASDVPVTVGTLTDRHLAEVSGFAASRAHPGLLWAENDSGNPADVYLIEPSGTLRMTLHIDGAMNIDWEDFASFDDHGHHYLLLADTGDNFALRPWSAIHVIEEPERIADAHAKPAWSITFRWPEGARDCEAVAVDVASNSILLISKRTVPARLYRLPLHPDGKGIQVAQPLADLVGIVQPDKTQSADKSPHGRYRAQVTAADVAPDRSALAVLTYHAIYLYPRPPDLDWAQAVASTPRVISFGPMRQAEAMAWSLDGHSLYVSGEQLPAPIRHIDLTR